MNPPIEPPKTIDDSADRKPTDWVDSPTFPDPNDAQPLDWDVNAQKMIVDNSARKPSTWY